MPREQFYGPSGSSRWPAIGAVGGVAPCDARVYAGMQAARHRIWRRRLSYEHGCIRCASLFSPSLGVHADHEEPEGQRALTKQTGDLKVDGECVFERRVEIGQVPYTSDRQQHAHRARKKRRPDDEVADEKAIEAEKH